MRILVTGGAGFIGSNLTFALLGSGHEVGVIDDLSVGRIENLHPAAWFRRLSILDDEFAGVVREFAPEVVVHLAAQASVVDSVRDPARTREVNVSGTRRVAAAARDSGSRLVLSASSAAVYGEPVEVPIDEGARTAPTNPYGASKLAAEGILAAELEGTDVDFASLRFSNVYGPRQDALGEGGVIAIFFGRMAADSAPVVFGDGRQTRDFIFVGDVVAAILDAMEAEAPLREGRGPEDSNRLTAPAYNISTGERTSLEELLGVTRGITGYLGPVEREPARDGDIVDSALDPSKAEHVFGWSSAVGLEQGLAVTWRWYAANR